MGRIPILKPREICRLLEALGFVLLRQRGTTVPNHSGRDVSPILLRQIAKDIGMTAEEFVERGRR